ncbi:MAG: hypothetical protein J6I65_07965 [Lachnospiraceae bacterium]|nr:hypothetical protein [Lachnospiraceae bacterium]
MKPVNQIFYKGQKIKIRKKCTLETGGRGGRVVGTEEKTATIIGLYKNFALCKVNGLREAYSYWDLERAMRGGIL